MLASLKAQTLKSKLARKNYRLYLEAAKDVCARQVLRRGRRGEADGKIFQPIDIESRALGQEYLALSQSRRPRWLVGRGTAGRWGGCPAAT